MALEAQLPDGTTIELTEAQMAEQRRRLALQKLQADPGAPCAAVLDCMGGGESIVVTIAERGRHVFEFRLPRPLFDAPLFFHLLDQQVQVVH